jgi:hypothetical protein
VGEGGAARGVAGDDDQLRVIVEEEAGRGLREASDVVGGAGAVGEALSAK